MYTSCWWPIDCDLADRAQREAAVRIGSDIQLGRLTEAPARAAVFFQEDLTSAAGHIAAALTLGASLVGTNDLERQLDVTFRAWRVNFLSRWLRPDFPVDDSSRRAMRLLDRELSHLL